MIRARAENVPELILLADGERVGRVPILAGKVDREYRSPMKHRNRNGTSQRLDLGFASKPGTTVGIDWIRLAD